MEHIGEKTMPIHRHPLEKVNVVVLCVHRPGNRFGIHGKHHKRARRKRYEPSRDEQSLFLAMPIGPEQQGIQPKDEDDAENVRIPPAEGFREKIVMHGHACFKEPICAILYPRVLA